jgi:TatA/E family protein of Tat protein translocase
MGGGFSPSHWLIVGLIALLVFGPKKLPEIGKSIGRALREFNKVRDDFMESVHSAVEPDSRPAPARSSASAAAASVTAESPSLPAGEEEDAVPYGTDFHAAPDRPTLVRAASAASGAGAPGKAHQAAPHSEDHAQHG